MQWLDEQNAADYLRARGWIGPHETVAIQELAGGVSNQVLYVARPDLSGGDFVLKQVRPQLRTPEPWFARVERVWREVEVLRVCQELLAAPGTRPLRATTPQILHEDRDQYTFAMTAAPRDHRVWKRDLLAGQVDGDISRSCGRLLGRLHARSWLNKAIEARLGDRQLFDELRIDPYYRFVASRHESFAPHMLELEHSLAAHPRSLVHADFSPKNLLLSGDVLMMVDFETGHYGDPAFDLGFFLSHLVLKAVHTAPNQAAYLALTELFWDEYRAELIETSGVDEYAQLVARGIQHFAGCFWARVDGKSQVDYLTNAARRELVRRAARRILLEKPLEWRDVLSQIQLDLAGF